MVLLLLLIRLQFKWFFSLQLTYTGDVLMMNHNEVVLAFQKNKNVAN